MKLHKKIGCLLLVIMLMIGCIGTVQAASGSSSISLNRTSASIGQTVTATVTFSGSGVRLGSVQYVIQYDSSRFQFVSVSSGNLTATGTIKGVWYDQSADGSGSASVTVTVTLKAIAAGSASVSVSITDCSTTDFTSVSMAGASRTVSVSAPPSSSQQSSKPSSKPQSSQASSKPQSSHPSSSTPQSSASAEDPQDTTIRVMVGEQEKIVVNSLIGVEIPEGFEVRQDEYRGQSLDVLHHTTQDMLLMYLTDADGANGGYYRFNRTDDSFFPFVRISVNAARYTATELARGTKVPSGWTETMVQVAGQAVPAYESGDQAYQGFYLIFATNEQGDEGFYLYDSAEGTIQRYVQSSGYEPVTNPDGMTVADPNGNFFERLLADREIFVTMCVAWALVILIAGAWLVFHFARKQAHVSDKQRKKKEEKITKKLEKRAKKAAKKNKIAQQKPEIGSLDEEIEAEMPENEAEIIENDAEVTEIQEETEAETEETETQTESEITE